LIGITCRDAFVIARQFAALIGSKDFWR